MNGAPHASGGAGQAGRRQQRPRLQTLAALALALVIAVAVVRWADLAAAPQPDAAVVVQRSLRFTDQADGTIRVSDAVHGHTVETIAVGADAFLRSAVRGLARERKRQGVDDTPPFDLLGRADGRLTLVDTGTGRRIDLESFGTTNAAAFRAAAAGSSPQWSTPP